MGKRRDEENAKTRDNVSTVTLNSFVEPGSNVSVIQTVDVIIVGGGLSGLTAANALLSKDRHLKVLILEAKDRLGGRLQKTFMKVRKEQKRPSTPYEVGGHAFCDSQTHIVQLVQQLGLNVHPIYTKGNKIGQTNTGKFHRYTSGIPKLGSALADLDLKLFIAKIDEMSENVESYPDLDAVNTAMFLRKEMYMDAAIEAVEILLLNTLGLEASLVSALYFLVFVQGAGGMYNLFNHRQFQIKEGVHILLVELDSRTGCTRMFERVYKIDQFAGKAHLMTTSNQRYRCDYVILAIPPADVLKIDFKPRLPPEKELLLRQFTPGHLTKFVTTYSSSFWRDLGDSGEVIGRGGPSTTCNTGAVHVTFDATSPTGYPALAGTIGGQSSIDWSQVDKKTRRLERLQQLAAYWGEAALSPVDYAEEVWLAGGGAIAPGAMELFDQLNEPFDRIHFAGTEVSNRWPGFMNGAVHAGLKASSDVLFIMRPHTLSMSDYVTIGQPIPSTEHYTDIATKVGYVKKGAMAVVGAGVAFMAWQMIKNRWMS